MLIVDIMLAYSAHTLHRRNEYHTPISLTFLVFICLLAFAAHIVAAMPLAEQQNISTAIGQSTVIRALVCFGIIPALLFARLAREILSQSFAQGLYGLDTGIHPK